MNSVEIQHKAANDWSDKNWPDHAWKVKKEAFLAGAAWQHEMDWKEFGSRWREAADKLESVLSEQESKDE